MEMNEFAEEGIELFEQFDCDQYESFECEQCGFQSADGGCLHLDMLYAMRGMINNG